MKWLTQFAGKGGNGFDHWIIQADDYYTEYVDDLGDRLWFPTKEEAQKYIDEVIL
jgi:hypothetical protein